MYGGRNGFIEKESTLLGLITNGKMEYQRQWFFGGIVPMQFKSSWQEIWSTLTPQGKALWFSGVEMMFACCIAAFIVAIFLGAACVRASWRENVADASLENLRVKYFTPKFAVSSLRNRLRRSLSRNPIGWLHHYSASARLTKWSWCLFLIGVELFFAGNSNDLYTVQTGLGFLLVLGVLFSSVGSFRDELETGAFELLLVTPIREGQILLGRVRGIWQQFLPAFAIYAAGAVFLASGWANDGMASAAVESISRFTLLFLTAPFVGLYFSLLRWNFLVSWIGASLVTLSLPVLLRGVSAGPPLAPHEMIVCQLGVAAICAWRIWRRLQNRLALSPSVLATAA
jgi:ABC-type transport system involved in cytochrome c biogenesis permease component